MQHCTIIEYSLGVYDLWLFTLENDVIKVNIRFFRSVLVFLKVRLHWHIDRLHLSGMSIHIPLRTKSLLRLHLQNSKKRSLIKINVEKNDTC